MKKCAIYGRVSTSEQHVATQLYDLRQLAVQRGFEVVKEYTDCGIPALRHVAPDSTP
jgi:DNA invertase Pin-like site-specific DNA recombinase